MIKIELSEVVAEVRRIAAEQPEKIYREEMRSVSEDGSVGTCACSNVEQDDEGNWQGSCLIGTALFNLGVTGQMFEKAGAIGFGLSTTIEKLVDHEFVTFTTSGIEMTETDAYDNFTNQYVRWMSVAQMAQDNGRPWGEAVAEADREYILA